MSEEQIKPCPFCGKEPTIKQAGKTNYWWVGCEIHIGIESSGCGVSHSDYDKSKAILKWNQRAVGCEPVMPKAPEPSALASVSGSELSAMVDAFLAWPLPDDVCADQCACERGYPHRSGTNLLDATQARAMLEHVLVKPQ